MLRRFHISGAGQPLIEFKLLLCNILTTGSDLKIRIRHVIFGPIVKGHPQQFTIRPQFFFPYFFVPIEFREHLSF